MRSLVFFALLALLLWGVAAVFTTQGDSETLDGPAVRVEVEGVFVSPGSMAPVVILSEQEGTRTLPIWVGFLEAEAIRRNLAGEEQPRPMTHDLLASAVRSLGGAVTRIVVTRVENGTYYARVHLEANGDTLSLDARPSDAIAVALGAGAPIFVAAAVLASAGENSLMAATAPGDVGCGLFCQPLDEELAAALHVTSGVLVADVSAAQESSGLERGDVIVQVAGEPAVSVQRVQELIAGFDDGQRLPIEVVRNGDRVELQIACP